MSRIAVIGAGAWGTTLAILCAEKGILTSLWAKEPDVSKMIEEGRENRTYLPDIPIPSSIVASSDLGEVTQDAEYVFMAVPAKFIRETLRGWKPANPNVVVCSVSKGLEAESGKRPSEIILDALGKNVQNPLCVLSGPNLASEIARGLPAATVVASTNHSASDAIQSLLMMERFRVYTSEDVVGVEWGGVLKNVFAIAAGITEGLDLGDNAKSALITRSLAEMARFGVAHGARAETFYGLSGLGDLLCTCAGELSRNYRVGSSIAKGRRIDDLLAEMKAIPEGAHSAQTVLRMAKSKNISMPITEQVVAVLYEGKDLRQVFQTLMRRDARSE